MSPRPGGASPTRAVMRSLVTAALVVVLYAVLPVEGADTASSVVVLAVGLLVLVVLVAVRVRQIVQDTQPRLRAAEGLALVVPLFVAVFAWAYLLMSQADPESFSEPLTRVGAAYFTLSVLSTVGFGDISAQNDVSRLLVSAQIVLTFTVLAAVVRLIVDTGRAAQSSRGSGA